MRVTFTIDNTYALAGYSVTRAYELPDGCDSVHVCVRGEAPDKRKGEISVFGYKGTEKFEAERVADGDCVLIS